MDSEIDLGIDHFQFQAGLKAEPGEQVKSVGAAFTPAAQNYALAVISLLHAGVEIAVPVEGQEELLQKLQCILFVIESFFQIFRQIGVHVLIKPADCIVIISTAPHDKMQDPEHLQSLREIPGRLGGYSGEGLCHSFISLLQGKHTVAMGQFQNAVEDLDLQCDIMGIFFLSGCGKAFPEDFQFLLFGNEAHIQQPGIIRINIAHIATFVDPIAAFQFSRLFRGKQLRYCPDCSGKDDPFLRKQYRCLLAEYRKETHGTAVRGGDMVPGKIGCQQAGIPGGLPEDMVFLAYNEEIAHFPDSFSHNITLLIPYSPKISCEIWMEPSGSNCG